MTTITTCPQCGQYTVISRSLTLYQCIACDFERDLDAPDDGQENPPPLALGTLILGLLAFLIL